MYRAYRGRRSGGCLIPILCVLCVIAGLVSLFLHRSVVYTPEGTLIRIPFSDKTISLGGGEPPVEEEEVNLIIEEPEDTSEETQPEATDGTSQQARVEESVFVPLDTVLNQAAFDALLERIKNTSVNTVVLEVKAEDGRLAFASADPIAANAKAADNTALKNALSKLEMSGLNAVAQISCLRDNLAPRARRSLALQTNDNLVWLDPQENRWLNPYQAGTGEYLGALLAEVYDLGFKEVLLTRLHFPINGRQSIIRFDGTDKAGAINSIIAALKAVAQAKGGELAAVYENHAANETQTMPGGQDIKVFLENFYRIYTPVPQAANGRGVDLAVLDKMNEAVGEEFATRFVPCIVLDGIGDAALLNDLSYTAKCRGNGCMYIRAGADYPDGVWTRKD